MNFQHELQHKGRNRKLRSKDLLIYNVKRCKEQLIILSQKNNKTNKLQWMQFCRDKILFPDDTDDWR